jgi:hypothetical protein
MPWFVSTTAVVALAAALAVVVNVLVGPYFERSRADEADPFAMAPGGPVDEPSSVVTPAATASAGTPPSPTPAAAVLYEGEWRDGEPGHNGAGRVRIGRDADGKLVLRVEEFSVTNGPDLFVVLSPDADAYAAGSLNLGGLKATDGNFNYEIPDGTDLSQYKSAVVWCRSFDVTFAYATLVPV